MSGLYEALRNQLKNEKGTALATVVRGPDSVGSKLLLFSNGSTQGTLGLPGLDALALPDAEQAMWKGEAQTFTYIPLQDHEPYEVFIEGFPPPPALIIVGAGHIAIPLTTFAKTLNYHVTVVDARAAFATHERFPQADELIVEWPDEVLERMELNPSTSVAVLTHDPKFDEPTLKVVLRRNVGYVGAIGSRKTSEERAERLRSSGLTEEQMKRLHGPIGLNIGGKAPEEIALAIMAEIVATRSGKLSSIEAQLAPRKVVS